MQKRKIPSYKKNLGEVIDKYIPTVKLKTIRYSEYEGTDKEWTLEEVDIDNISLIVGKNASGKSRFLSLISSLAKLLTGEIPTVFLSGTYFVRLSADSVEYTYLISFKGSKVIKEELVKDGVKVLERGDKGAGTIWAQELNSYISFEAPQDQIVAKNRRDTIQHPFFEDLHTWASQLRFFQFGTPLGKNNLFVASELKSLLEDTIEVKDANQIVQLYIKAFKKFGTAFDKSILSDLKLLGYDCTAVGAEDADKFIVKGAPILWLYLKERDIRSNISQIDMSQGMFRALSLIIHFNYCTYTKISRTILIDDIGEGLDFARSQSLIRLLDEHALKCNIQLIMTTNDRFVMNAVPLVKWGVISRNKNKVKLFNYSNSKEVFDEFDDLGLNNFEFFSTGFFEEGFKCQ